MDTPRRKRGGGGSNDEAPKPAETPGEAIVKRLTAERMKEIREQLTREGEEIRKLEKEVELLSSKEELADAQLDEIQARYILKHFSALKRRAPKTPIQNFS